MSLTMGLDSVYHTSHCLKVKAFHNHQNKMIVICHVSSLCSAYNHSNGSADTAAPLGNSKLEKTQDIVKWEGR
jgi:hypothetical protein